MHSHGYNFFIKYIHIKDAIMFTRIQKHTRLNVHTFACSSLHTLTHTHDTLYRAQHEGVVVVVIIKGVIEREKERINRVSGTI